VLYTDHFKFQTIGWRVAITLSNPYRKINIRPENVVSARGIRDLTNLYLWNDVAVVNTLNRLIIAKGVRLKLDNKTDRYIVAITSSP